MKINIFIFLFLLTIIINGCGKEKEILDPVDISAKDSLDTFHYKEQLIGAWVEKMPYHDNICDTIIFTKNNKIESYFPLVGMSYFIADHTMTFTDGEWTGSFLFSLEAGVLTIFGFVDRSITQEIKNISFTKLNTL